jgi:iron complex transport system substrate-binding protein
VLFVVGRDPLFVAGPGSHIDSLIRLGGGENVAAEVGAAYRRLSLEAALERMPDVIVDTSDNRPGAPRGRTPGAWEQWSFVPAVAENRVWHVEPDLLVIPGVRLPEMAELMARLIHPEAFGPPADDDIGGRRPAPEEVGVAGPS